MTGKNILQHSEAIHELTNEEMVMVQGGAGMVEYIILVGVVALLAIAA